MDMDGVLIHEGMPIPGADAFLKRLREPGSRSSSSPTTRSTPARDLHARLRRIGLDVPEEASGPRRWPPPQFLDEQRPGGTAYVIGEAGLTTALHDIGYILTDTSRTTSSSARPAPTASRRITKAIRLINDGARFIATNPDETGPSTEGPLPATGSVAALISQATGMEPYFVGKPNPLMMRSGAERDRCALRVHAR